jgi:hypothetical protein
MTEIFWFLLDEYITKIYLIIDFFDFLNKDKYQREMAFFSFTASFLVTVILSIVASIEHFSKVCEYLEDFFDHFFGLISDFFKLLIFMVVATIVIFIWFFVGAFVINLCGSLFLMPLAYTIVDLKSENFQYQLFYFIFLSLFVQIAFYLLAEFGRFLEKISYYLNEELNLEKTKPISLFSECKTALTELFAKTSIRNIVFKLGGLFLMYVAGVILLVPLFFISIWNLIILPYEFIKFAFRGLVRAIRS